LALPLLRLRDLLVPLLLEALLVADRHGDLLLRLDELVLHVDEDLVEHLLRVFGLRDQIVQVRPDQRAQPRKDPHDSLFSFCWTSSCPWRAARSYRSSCVPPLRPPRGTSPAARDGSPPRA